MMQRNNCCFIVLILLGNFTCFGQRVMNNPNCVFGPRRAKSNLEMLKEETERIQQGDKTVYEKYKASLKEELKSGRISFVTRMILRNGIHRNDNDIVKLYFDQLQKKENEKAKAAIINELVFFSKYDSALTSGELKKIEAELNDIEKNVEKYPVFQLVVLGHDLLACYDNSQFRLIGLVLLLKVVNSDDASLSLKLDCMSKLHNAKVITGKFYKQYLWNQLFSTGSDAIDEGDKIIVIETAKLHKDLFSHEELKKLEQFKKELLKPIETAIKIYEVSGYKIKIYPNKIHERVVHRISNGITEKTIGDIKISIVNNELLVNDKNYGPVKKTDNICIYEKNVIVNDEERSSGGKH